MGLYSYLSSNQDAQSGGMIVSPLENQVKILHLICITHLLACKFLPVGQGDSSKVRDVVHLRNGANGATHRKVLAKNLNHRGEALDRQLALAGEETS